MEYRIHRTNGTRIIIFIEARTVAIPDKDSEK